MITKKIKKEFPYFPPLFNLRLNDTNWENFSLDTL